MMYWSSYEFSDYFPHIGVDFKNQIKFQSTGFKVLAYLRLGNLSFAQNESNAKEGKTKARE